MFKVKVRSSQNIEKEKIINFMHARVIAMLLSLVLIACAVGIIAQKGINYGIDFLGGLKLTYHISKTDGVVGDGEIADLLRKNKIEAQVQKFGGDDAQRFLVKIKQPTADMNEAIISITKTLSDAFPKVVLEAEESVGPRVGQELRIRGQKTVIFILLAMLLYVGFRFDFVYAPGAIIALGHDVIVTMGVLVALGVEFNLTILAALLTIAGYSINDTIIIFDRIREKSKEMTPSNVISLVNESLTETLSRTIMTAFTTMIAVLILFFVAGGDIKDFALTFLVGIIVGTYSSIFIASPIFIEIYKRQVKKK